MHILRVLICVCLVVYVSCQGEPGTESSCTTDDDCKNDAKCDTKKCKCKDGTKGDKCDIVTDCETGGKYEKCKGDAGICTFETDNAVCKCSDSKYLDEVEGYCKATTPCNPNPCKNEGKCFDAGANTKCICKNGYAGETCEIDLGPCIPNPCKHHGYCLAVGSKAICACKHGFTGETCEIVPTTCTSNPCEHGGHCAVVEDKVVCTCINEYTGEMCEIDPDPCYPNPCKHGGYCEFYGGKVYCLCLPINIGERCEIETCLDENDCKNEATCEGQEGEKFCICQNGTYGGRCRTISDCGKGGKYETCKGENGECTLENGSAVCNCTEDDRKLDESRGQCRKPCAVDTDCLNEAKCEGEKDDVKFCDCKPGTLGDTCEIVKDCEWDGKYSECTDDYGNCTFVNRSSVCSCADDKKLDESEGYCKTPCDSDKDCLNEGRCKGEKDGTKFCDCKPGTMDLMCEFITECEMDGKYEHCKGDDGECTFVNGSAVCNCNDDKELDESIGRCNFKFCIPNPCKDGSECTFDKETNSGDCKCKDQNKNYDFSSNTCKDACIDDNDCRNDAICQEKGGKKFCVCQPGTYGDRCESIDDCKKGGKYEDCRGDKVCTFEKGAAVCKCTDDDRKLDNSTGQCRKSCDADTDCLNEAKCEGVKDGVKFCGCKPGTLGDTCEIVKDCEKGGKYQHCKDGEGNCTFVNGTAVCNCTDDKIVDESKGYCNFEFCVPNPCKDGSECTFNEEENTGVCKCHDENKYYDYSTDKCTEPDKCILKKITCGENMECVKGDCKCIDKFKEVNKTCIPNFCSPNPCFARATCDDTDGKLKCSCKKGEYFDGKKCTDGSCFLGDDYKNKCTEPCPKNLEKNKNGVCEPMKDFELCSDDCGYGYCVKKKGGNNTCSCISSIAHNREKKADGKCTLINNVVCATSRLVENDLTKCNCTGNRYKQASNGITCELLTCLDEIAQDDCKQKGAQCVMDGKKGYDCKCPTGFKMDTNKQMCADPCSLENAMSECLKKDQFCYNSISKLNDLTGDCRCPPTLKETVGEDNSTKCAELAENVYTVTGIPVKKTKYAMEGRINYILLNADLIQSMKSTFKHFDYGYLQDYQLNGDVLNVSIWIQFNSSVSDSELHRIPLQARSFTCEDCNSDLSLWPPHVILDKELLDGVSSEKLGFCSEKSKNSLCGKEAVCNENKCSCSPGFDTVLYSIRDIEKKFRIQRCEDIDECVSGTHSCTENTTCVNLPGDYYCQCKANFKKEKDPVHSRVIEDKNNCYDLCTPNPCNKGTCVLKEDKSFDCKCSVGSEGSFCDATDVNLSRAMKDARIVGGVLGAILGLTLIGIFLLYRRMKKNSSSEEFSTPARQPEREMDSIRRSVSGMVNRGYE